MAMICPGWQFLFGFIQRGEVRARYNIEGNGCTDCLTHWCCDCCVWLFGRWVLIVGTDSRGTGGADERGRYDAGDCWAALSLSLRGSPRKTVNSVIPYRRRGLANKGSQRKKTKGSTLYSFHSYSCKMGYIPIPL